MACSSGEAPVRRRSSSECSSPEFEFWMLRNPSMPEPNLLTADELFSDGVLLPLHLLPPHDHHHHHHHHSPTTNVSSSPSILSTPSSSSSKRWLDIFKLATADKRPSEKEKIKKDIPRSSSATAAAELNINLWPFSRSRSAGAAGAAKHKTSRKASSAPCSRSNSRGESSAASSARRLFPASPGRAGVPVGRASPVWQPKRQSGKSTEKRPGIRGLNLNANTCIGYRTRPSCRGDDKHEITGGDRIRGDGNGNGNLFNLRAFFSKKVY
ncbi:hypothetical protein J5N97_020482 [Dioscorea zingiberensis]|uniref:Uncharacterized protein n=1 Tax=Dioscorea zingiberensis TaxID=325984 RepID=A0A9D5CFZ1_9LILI|nr:hypothetical protein J5N97_020482 [Dioscorea zingiberensis]